MTGTVLNPEGNPAGEAYVYAYKSERSLPSPSHKILEGDASLPEEIPPEAGGSITDYGAYRGPADYKSSKTDESGHYRLVLPPGGYYLVARRRLLKGFDRGPLGPRDFSSLVSPEISLKDRQTLIMGFKLIDLARDPLFYRYYTSRTGSTIIKGFLKNPEGKPVKGIFITADRRRRIGRKPEFISDKTGADGVFILYLPGQGKYFLGAKKSVLGKPWEIELPGHDRNSLQVKEQQIKLEVILKKPSARGGDETLSP